MTKVSVDINAVSNWSLWQHRYIAASLLPQYVDWCLTLRKSILQTAIDRERSNLVQKVLIVSPWLDLNIGSPYKVLPSVDKMPLCQISWRRYIDILCIFCLQIRKISPQVFCSDTKWSGRFFLKDDFGCWSLHFRAVSRGKKAWAPGTNRIPHIYSLASSLLFDPFFLLSIQQSADVFCKEIDLGKWTLYLYYMYYSIKWSRLATLRHSRTCAQLQCISVCWIVNTTLSQAFFMDDLEHQK